MDTQRNGTYSSGESAVSNMENSFSSSLKSLDMTPTVNSTKEFLQSNSAIARFSFLLLAIFIFVIILKICIRLLAYFILNKSGDVTLISGMIDANEPYTFPQDPNSNSNAKTLSKSNNAENGVEFTWSVWLYVDSITSSATNTVYKHVFSKGNNNWNSSSSNPSGVAYPNNAPGVYLSPTTNDLYVFMNTYDIINEEIIVNSFPLNKWFNLIICCVNKSVDVYINGIVVNSHKLVSVPKQNYGDVYVCNNGGFSGNLSNLSYYNKAISLKKIQQIVSAGPSLTYASGSKTKPPTTNYLSMDWYYQNPLFGVTF